jgi:hypothetical protein
MRWAAMEVLEVEDDSSIWVPHVSGGGSSWLKGTVAGARQGFCAEAPAWQHPWRLLACHIGKIGKLE